MKTPRDTNQPDRLQELEKENKSLRDSLDKVLAEDQQLRKELEGLRKENERLRKELEEALRSLKRQSAPFSKGEPKADPKLPGRKSGVEYGQRGSRPAPSRVDQEIRVPLPENCLNCGGEVIYEDTKPQFQEDIVRLTVVRRFDIEIGRCACCGRYAQGRHPLQTSDALGAAHVQLGPEALSLAVHLNKEMGISHERVARVLELGYGLNVSRSALCRAITRLGNKAAPTYQQLRAIIQESPVNWMDETSWRVAGRLQWLWVVVSPQVTVYDILPGRGFREAASILEEDYLGFLHHDGLRSYYRFIQACHQSCLSHLIHRCDDMVKIASPSDAFFPLSVRDLLQKALALRDRYGEGEISLHGFHVATGHIEASMDRLLEEILISPIDRRLAKHLRHEQPHLFTFLHFPGIDATNNAAERAIRPAVIARKTWGGNRTDNGAKAQKILTSILRTCKQQGKDTFSRLIELMRSPIQLILDLVPASLSP